MKDDELAEARALDAARTPGQWQWFGNVKMREVYLSTVDRGRTFVMDFARWGMTGAQPRFQVTLDERPGYGQMARLENLGDMGPQMVAAHRSDFVGIGHPDARFIAAASVLVPRLIAEVDRLRLELEQVRSFHESTRKDAETL
jgi:hypothetical protein